MRIIEKYFVSTESAGDVAICPFTPVDVSPSLSFRRSDCDWEICCGL